MLPPLKIDPKTYPLLPGLGDFIAIAEAFSSCTLPVSRSTPFCKRSFFKPPDNDRPRRWDRDEHWAPSAPANVAHWRCSARLQKAPPCAGTWVARCTLQHSTGRNMSFKTPPRNPGPQTDRVWFGPGPLWRVRPLAWRAQQFSGTSPLLSPGACGLVIL